MLEAGRSSGQCRIEEDRNMLDMAQELHEYVTGSSDVLDYMEAQKFYTELLFVFNSWKESSHEEHKQYDDSVRDVIGAVLSEYEVKESRGK